MPVAQNSGDLDDRLRELFRSFDSSAVLASHEASRRRTPLTRGRAVAWAFAVVAVLVVALISVDLVRSRPVHTPTKPPPSTAPTTGVCTATQLTATVVFNQLGTELGAIRLSNTASTPCSLSGRPQVVVYDQAGHSLGLEESAYQRAPDLPAPTRPVELGASGSSSQGIVELDWCGFTTTGGHIDIRFGGWTEPVVEQDSSIRPVGFSPPKCLDPSQEIVRGRLCARAQKWRGRLTNGGMRRLPAGSHVTERRRRTRPCGPDSSVQERGRRDMQPLWVPGCRRAQRSGRSGHAGSKDIERLLGRGRAERPLCEPRSRRFGVGHRRGDRRSDR